MNIKANVYVTLVALLGSAILIGGATRWESADHIRLIFYLLFAYAASRLKVALPGITATMSVNFLFVLMGIVELHLSETLLLGCSANLLQCVWHAEKRPKPVQMLFNVCSMACSIAAADATFHFQGAGWLAHSFALRLIASASVFFLINTLLVSGVVSLTEKKTVRQIWSECYFWSFPYYLVGAAIAALVSSINRFVGWQTSLLVLPVVYWVYRSYRLYLGRLEDEKNHVEAMASLHLRTIEALALAIDAKDHTTHEHLRRVRVYAVELGKEFGVSGLELEALRAAALLHDIGKLAVPEHILSKPGRLSPEEFEKMKIHPLVGAEILERVQFPYPVVPIVRTHHEKWDGSGYPHGLRGEEIPLGARILSVVDCLDALASHRPYRPALTLDQAMKVVISESGTSFDPRIVERLQKRYIEFERIAQSQQVGLRTLSKEIKVERDVAPGAGFDFGDKHSTAPGAGESTDFLSSIASARQEAQILFELSQDLGSSLSLEETLSVFSVRLKHMIPYDSIAIYVLKGETLVPEYVSGENFRRFSSRELPLGQGLAGWVAQNRTPILNGNPAMESGCIDDAARLANLNSALAVPLVGVNGVIGVLALYHSDQYAFTKDHLRILMALSSKVAFSVENALKYKLAESTATTDYLTSLPNARSLFLHLDREMARCKRCNNSLAVLVCDLNGFKLVNDRFGHLVGNKVLQVMAKKLQLACREYDYVARMGGDEFVVILPGAKQEILEQMIERFRRLSVETGLEVCGETVLSVSVGQAVYPEDGMDAEQLLAEADRRMYGQKQLHYDDLRTEYPIANFKLQTTRVC
jgi:diguanylate cyclase (GGDEF)-like protein/putative nucleotidyltransferase with HDIG domain